jgi:hypothetical protein
MCHKMPQMKSKYAQSHCEVWVMWPKYGHMGMGYGLLKVYGLSLVTKLVNAETHGLLQVMGSDRDGLSQRRLYNSLLYVLPR